MSIEKERKAFEDWLKETNKTLYSFSQEFIDDDSTESLCLQWAWTAWNASLNREGYKLVPIKCTNNMAHAAKEVNGRLSAFKYGDVWEAMIGACDE